MPKNELIPPKVADTHQTIVFVLILHLLQSYLQATTQPVTIVEADYQSLFGGEVPAVSVYAHDYEEIKEDDIRQFLVIRGMPVTDNARYFLMH